MIPRPSSRPVSVPRTHTAASTNPRRPRAVRGRRRASGSLAVLLAVVAHAVAADGPRAAVVGIVPTDDTDPRDVWIATAVEQTLAWRLQRSGLCRLVPSGRCYAARTELTSADKPPAWTRVLRVLGVQRQLAGTCTGPPHAATLTLRWIDVTTDRTLATARLGPQPVLPLIDDATRWILSRLGPDRLDRQTRQRLLEPLCRSAGSLEAFAEAVLASRRGDLSATADKLEQALQFEDVFLPAQLMLVQIQTQVPGVPRQRAAGNLRLLRRLARERHDDTTLALVMLTQGTLYRLRGVDEPAAKLLEQALAQARKAGASYVELVALETLADHYAARAARTTAEKRTAALHDAVRTEQQALALARRMHDQLAELAACRRLAELARQLDDPDTELAQRKRVIELARAIDSSRHLALGEYELGRFYLHRKQAEAAITAFQACLKRVPDALRPQVLSHLAEAYALAGQLDQAIETLRKVARHLEEASALADQLACLVRLSELQQKAGRIDDARQSLQEAIDLAHALRSDREAELRKRLAGLSRQP